MSQNTPRNDQPLIDFVDSLKEGLVNNNLPTKLRLLLVEAYIKNCLVDLPDPIPNEKDWTKYSFLGYFLFRFFIDPQLADETELNVNVVNQVNQAENECEC